MRLTAINDAPRVLTQAEADAVYDALVLAGARDDTYERSAFIRYATGARDVEWRFQGTLGFGGKLYFDGRHVPHVGCYREDLTSARAETIDRTNERLTALFPLAGRSALARSHGGEDV